MKHRKLLVLGVIFAAATILCAVDKVTGAILLDFYKWLVGLYFVGNVGTKIANGKKNVKEKRKR